jgi:hypothetical protein
MSQRKTTIIVAMAVCLLAAPLLSGIAVAQSPGQLVGFHGLAQDGDGNTAPAGETIVMAVDGEEVARETTDANGAYGTQSFPIVTNTTAGTDITFFLGGVGGTQAVDANGDPLVLQTGSQTGINPRTLTFDGADFSTDAPDPETVTESADAIADGISIDNENFDISGLAATGLPSGVESVELSSPAASEVADSGSVPSPQTFVDITPQDADGEVDVSQSVTVELRGAPTGGLNTPVLFHNPGSGFEELDTTQVGDTLQASTNNGLSPFAVAEGNPDTGGDDDDDDGGGGGSVDPAAPDEEGEDAPPSVEEIQSTLDLVVPTTDTATEITDAEPDTPGVTVNPTETESVSQITFENQDVTGSVQITEYTEPPEEIKTAVTESVVAAGAIDTGGDGDAGGGGGTATVNVISVTDISPDNEAAEDSAATVTLSVSADEVDNPERVTVVKETYDFEQQETTWSELETTLEEAGDEEVTVSARVESFSLFAVAEVTPAEEEQQQQQQDEQVDDDEQPTDDGDSGAGVVIGLLVVVAVIGAAVYLYSQPE